MIDLTKYKGHSTEWTLDDNDWTWATSMFTDAGETNEADALLIEDAPLLLAEVERMRKWIRNQRVSLLVQVDDLDREVERLRGLLQEVADDYTDADGITYEIYCEFGGEEND